MIAIVGAGLTGLTLAHELRRTRVEHVIVEAADRPGGVIRSGLVRGRVLEWGPQRARLTGDLRDLIAQLDLQDRLVVAPAGLPLFVYAAGKLRRVPFTPREFILTDLLPPAAKLRLLLEPFTRRAADDERVAELFIRKVGRRAYENLLGPLYGGLYASDPADMVVGQSLANLLREVGAGRSLLLPLLRRGGRVSPPPAVSFDEGLQTLPLALHAANRENIRLGAVATRLGRAGDGFVLTAGGEDIRADRVVITTAARDAASLLRGIDGEAARRISALRYNPLAVVHLAAAPGLSALGYQVGLREKLLTRGVTFNDSLFGREDVHTAFLGGSRVPEVADWPDEVIGEAAVEEFRRVTGAPATVLSVGRASMPAWDYTWGALRDLATPSGVILATNWMARPGIPGRLAQARRLARELAGAGGA